MLDSPEARLSQVHELLQLQLVDTRDAYLLMGGRPEHAPEAGAYYVDFEVDDTVEYVW